MYRISQLAKLAGLSRSTLLYYEKLGLIKARRSANGYRHFTPADLQQLKLLKQLQAGGLSLKESKDCIESQLNYNVLEKKLAALDQEIEEKQQAQRLLAALLGKNHKSLRQWHSTLETSAPNAHFEWLKKQGLSEKDALRLRWLSKNIHQHRDYMQDFERLFSGLERFSPGSTQSSLSALKSINRQPDSILDIGCGPGASTLILAENTSARITALDNDHSSLKQLEQKAADRKMADQVTTCCHSMLDIPFKDHSFDLLWSEGSAYIMGFAKAVKEWRRLIKPTGHLVISELVWQEGEHPQEVKDFWQAEYPDMRDAKTRIKQAERAGYKVSSHFLLEKTAWDNYYLPLLDRITRLKHEMAGSQAITDLTKEIDIYQRFGNHFGYLMLTLQQS
ncbi:MerR family transcriptional regulator [Endozoicomonas sp. Mp262]|uniref:MerR family transcriptional regulator n=1 Tax=Endozoicomonas sp. Mp262 TaxID=2919499 RepID=UPI0021D84D25